MNKELVHIHNAILFNHPFIEKDYSCWIWYLMELFNYFKTAYRSAAALFYDRWFCLLC